VALAQFVCLWIHLDHLLDRVPTALLADALRAIPARFFSFGVIPRAPRLYELEPVVSLTTRGGRGSPVESFNSEVAADPSAPLSTSKAWRQVLDEAGEAVAAVRADHIAGRKHKTAPAQAASLGSVEAPPVPALDTVKKPPDERAELAAFPLVFVTRSLLARMWNNVLFVGGAIALLALTAWGYRVQSRSIVEALVWIDALVAVAVVLFVFVRMERDEILSHMTSTTPGEITWNGDFISKVVVYGLIPLAGIFATQFPSVGTTLAQWLEPVQKALP
jgi:hypothetical protein